jgi:multiple sugar transport system permease protein
VRLRAQSENALLTALLTVGAVAALVPFVWMVAFSFDTPQEFLNVPPPLIPSSFRLDNYRAVFAQVPMLRFLFNSLWVTSVSIIGQLITCSLAAYAFARLRFPGKNVLFVILLASLMIPNTVTVVPLFLLMRTLGLVNSDTALVLPGLVSAFGVFLLRQFFERVPREMEDAAKLDGANHLQIYLRIMLPMTRPALAALAILAFNATWNNFLWPLVVINSPGKMTLPLGMTFLQGQGGATSTGILTAAVTMSVIPSLLVFLLFQRSLVRGIALSSST